MKTLSRNKSIFAADDFAGEQILIREAFRKNGVPNPIYFFGNGQELLAALEALLARGEREDLPCLILMDIRMPVMDGWEAMGRIKGTPPLGKIPVVMLTNSASPEDREKSFQLGAAGYITKPSNLEGLAREMGALRGFWERPTASPLPDAHPPARKSIRLFVNSRMEISNQSVIVMDVDGILDLNSVGFFEEALVGLFDQGKYKIVLNLGKVAYVSSAGFGILISVIREVRAKGGDIKISEIQPAVYHVFEILGLHDLFRIFKTEREAIQDFGT